MKKLLSVACVAAGLAHGAVHAGVNCGTLTRKEAENLENLSTAIERGAQGALTLLTVEVASLPQNQSRVFFSLDGGSAISALQHGSSMKETASMLKELLPLRDQTTDPETKQKLEAFLRKEIMSLRLRADFVQGSIEKLRKHATPHWWNPNMDNVDKASKNMLQYLKACSY